MEDFLLRFLSLYVLGLLFSESDFGELGIFSEISRSCRCYFLSWRLWLPLKCCLFATYFAICGVSFLQSFNWLFVHISQFSGNILL